MNSAAERPAPADPFAAKRAAMRDEFFGKLFLLGGWLGGTDTYKRTMWAAVPDIATVNSSDRYALIAVQGPRAWELLAALETQLGPEALASFQVAETRVLGHACTLARTGYTGEDGVEIFVANSAAPAPWRAVDSDQAWDRASRS